MSNGDSLVELHLDKDIIQTPLPCIKAIGLNVPLIAYKAQEIAMSPPLIKPKKIKRHILSRNPFQSIFENFHQNEMKLAKHPEESSASINHSIHHTQFQQIQNILAASTFENAEKRQIINYVEELLYRHEMGLAKVGITETLAKLIFLLSEPKSFSLKTKHGIDSAFEIAMNRIKNGLKEAKPDPLAYQSALPIQIADSLILQDGSLNTALIPLLIKAFIPNTPFLQNYPLTLKSGLQLLHQSSKIQEKIEKISLPSFREAPGDWVIRHALKLPIDTPLTPRHAQITVLSAFLTHLRQGKSGCCFASFIAIEQQTMHPEQVLDDLIALIEKDGVIRVVDGIPQHFPYLLSKQSNDVYSHPLLKMWENAIAGMSEAKKGGLLKSALIKTVTYAFMKRVNKIKILSKGWEKEIVEKIENNLDKNTQYLYDPDYLSSAHTKQPGAFILFETKNDITKRINSGQAFFEFVRDNILEVLPQELHIFFDEYLKDPETLILLLKKYHPLNIEHFADRGDLNHLPYSPWKTMIGNDPKMVLEVYNELPNPLKTKESKPANAEELLSYLHELFLLHPQSFLKPYTPMRIQGLHTFSLLPQTDSIKPFFKKWQPFENPSRYCDLPLLKSMERKVNDWISDTLLNKRQKKIFLAHRNKLNSAKSIREFRFQTLELLKEFHTSDLSYSSTKTKLDRQIFLALPKKIRKELESQVITIADSNWQEGVNDIRYGIGINPATGQVELLSLLDNGKIHKFLNQNTYFKNHVWEFGL